MSKKSVNGGSSGGAEVKFAGNDSKSKMYEPKHKKKLIRVLTVIAYIFSVSLAAITLSLFYLFIYNPGKSGHGVGSSNGSTNDRWFIRNNEGATTLMNNTYSNYEREEPRALPLETIQEQKTGNVYEKKDEKDEVLGTDKFRERPTKKSFFAKMISTIAIT